MTEMTPEKAHKLREPFPAAVIGKLPKGGVMLDYVGHAAVTDRLLQVDPTWSWEPVAYDLNGLPAFDSQGNLWIRLTICGVTRLGIGDGKSAKEAIGDAIRNAAMRFGVALDLWAKEDLAEMHRAPIVTADPAWVEETLALMETATAEELEEIRLMIKSKVDAQEVSNADRERLSGGFLAAQRRAKEESA